MGLPVIRAFSGGGRLGSELGGGGGRGMTPFSLSWMQGGLLPELHIQSRFSQIIRKFWSELQRPITIASKNRNLLDNLTTDN